MDGPRRAVIDARPAVEPQPTGIGYYTDRILRHLPAADTDTTFVAWHAPGPSRRVAFADVPGLQERETRIPGRLVDALGSRTGFPRLEWLTGAFDTVLATNFLPPPTSSSGVVLVVHDLAFDRMPKTAPGLGSRWRKRFDAWLERASRVIVPSASARDDLLERHPADPERVDLIPHGVDPAFVPSSKEAVRATLRRFGIGDWPYALFVGGVEPRKNLLALVRAFSRVRDPDVRLVLAGGRVRWAPGEWDAVEDAIAGLGRSAWARIVRTGYVNEHDRRALMSGATMLAYPSRYEGFGFPVLEGFASGVPVLTSDTSSLPEVAGDAALLVDPSDEGAIAEGLARLFGDAELRASLAEAGLTRVQDYTWERCAAATADTLRRASGR